MLSPRRFPTDLIVEAAALGLVIHTGRELVGNTGKLCDSKAHRARVFAASDYEREDELHRLMTREHAARYALGEMDA